MGIYPSQHCLVLRRAPSYGVHAHLTFFKARKTSYRLQNDGSSRRLSILVYGCSQYLHQQKRDHVVGKHIRILTSFAKPLEVSTAQDPMVIVHGLSLTRLGAKPGFANNPQRQFHSHAAQSKPSNLVYRQSSEQ